MPDGTMVSRQMMNVGDYQFLKADEVLALFDYRKSAAKDLWKVISSKTPEKAINISRGHGRKMETLILTRSGYAIITFLTRKRLANKLGVLGDEEIGVPLVHSQPGQKRGRGRPRKTDIPAQKVDDTFQSDTD